MSQIILKSFFNFTTNKMLSIYKKRVQNLYIAIFQKNACYICLEIVNNAKTSISEKCITKQILEKIEDIIRLDKSI